MGAWLDYMLGQDEASLKRRREEAKENEKIEALERKKRELQLQEEIERIERNKKLCEERAISQNDTKSLEDVLFESYFPIGANSNEPSKNVNNQKAHTAPTNFGEAGEAEVEYALKWLPKDQYIVLEKMSTDKYGKKCIILKNESYIEEAQEYDHIVIGEQGIFLIETKNYKGKIIIDNNGNWIREVDGKQTGERNPIQQMKRHEKLLCSIVGDVPVINILCLAHPKIIIEGIENSSVTIVKSDLLCEYIEQYNGKVLKNEEMERIADMIRNKMM